MLMLLTVSALLAFISAWLVMRLYVGKQVREQEVEHLKARVGLSHHYLDAKTKDQDCRWCRLGLILGPKSGKEIAKTRQLLASAGYREERHLGAFFFFKYAFVLGLILVSLGLWTWFQLLPQVAILIPVVGLLLPERLLQLLAQKRLTRIKMALPDFLDMANICMNAGLSYLVAIQRVAEELKEIYPEICYEFNFLVDQIQIGVPRQEALKQFADRNPADEIKELIQVLSQNEKLGTPIGASINDFSRRLYQQRESVMEEKAAKTSAKMAVVILPFLMLPYFILMLGEKIVMLGRNW
ncbi:MAG: type II secretion system F family protein [Hydrogenovibrio sp.]|nr:type II secretion system F family protein [Hydrogenovibrio sp.]